MATPTSRFRTLVSAGLISAAAAAALAIGDLAATESCPAIDPPVAAHPAAAGLRVFVDPATGRIRRPTLEERRLVTTVSRDRSARTYEVRTRPDGMRIVKLDETFLMSVMGHTNPDGTVSYDCRKAPAPAAGAAENDK